MKTPTKTTFINTDFTLNQEKNHFAPINMSRFDGFSRPLRNNTNLKKERINSNVGNEFCQLTKGQHGHLEQTNSISFSNNRKDYQTFSGRLTHTHHLQQNFQTSHTSHHVSSRSLIDFSLQETFTYPCKITSQKPKKFSISQSSAAWNCNSQINELSTFHKITRMCEQSWAPISRLHTLTFTLTLPKTTLGIQNVDLTTHSLLSYKLSTSNNSIKLNPPSFNFYISQIATAATFPIITKLSFETQTQQFGFKFSHIFLLGRLSKIKLIKNRKAIFTLTNSTAFLKFTESADSLKQTESKVPSNKISKINRNTNAGDLPSTYTKRSEKRGRHTHAKNSIAPTKGQKDFKSKLDQVVLKLLKANALSKKAESTSNKNLEQTNFFKSRHFLTGLGGKSIAPTSSSNKTNKLMPIDYHLRVPI